MNRFRFRLQSVLRYRGAQEETKKREFGTVLGHLHHEEETYDRIVDTMKRHDDFREKSGKGIISTRNLINNFNYSRFLERKKFSQAKTVEKAQKSVDKKRSELVEATKKKKTLERLKERKLDEHTMAVIKEEQALIDEIATQSYANNDRE